MTLFTTFLISMFVTIGLIPIFRGLAAKVNAIDIPEARKMHKRPMPRSGGISMALGALVPVVIWAPGNEFVKAIIIGSGIVVFFGLIDDIKSLGYKVKFTGQIAAASIVILYGGVKIKSLGTLLPYGFLLPDLLAIPLTLIVIVGVTNAINLSDGLDGLAGGITLIGFICIGYLSYLNGNLALVILSMAIIGAVFGFLRFNTYPASIFMGDAGSQLLGFLAIVLSISLTQKNNNLSPILPLLIMGFPVLDTIDVMISRMANGKSPFTADKNHFHHKLIRLGLYHTESVLFIYITHAFMVSSAFIFRFTSEWFLLIYYLVFSGIIFTTVNAADKKRWKIKRYDLVDQVIKGKLRIFKEKSIIKVSFKSVEAGFTLLLVFTCFLPVSIPRYLSLLSMIFLVLILVSWKMKKKWTGGVMGFTTYLIIPFIVYMSQTNMVDWINHGVVKLYTISFALLAFCSILTLKFTRRRDGFKTSPLDFLILFTALVLPNLPDQRIQSLKMGLIAALIIVFFFSYEILKGELRTDLKRIGLPILIVLLVISLRGVIG